MFRLPILVLGILALTVVLGPSGRAAMGNMFAPQAAEAVEPAHGAAAAGGAAHGEEKPNILKDDVVLALSTLLVFVLLLVVLGKFAWKPLLKALHEREEYLEKTVEAAEHARQEAERLLADHRKQLAGVADQVRALIDKAHRDAEATSAEIIRKAQGEAEAARHRAEREIGNARDEAIVEIWNKAADLAVSVAGKVLPRELKEDDHRRLIELATSELPARPTATNGREVHP